MKYTWLLAYLALYLTMILIFLYRIYSWKNKIPTLFLLHVYVFRSNNECFLTWPENLHSSSFTHTFSLSIPLGDVAQRTRKGRKLSSEFYFKLSSGDEIRILPFPSPLTTKPEIVRCLCEINRLMIQFQRTRVYHNAYFIYWVLQSEFTDTVENTTVKCICVIICIKCV